MEYKTRLLLCGLGLLVLGRISSQECGNTLDKNVVMCALPVEDETVKPFDFKLCTHGVLIVSVLCRGDTCRVKNPSKVRKAIRWALPNLPTDLGILINVFELKDYLFGRSGSKLRRSNAINDFVKFVEDNRLTFVQTSGANQYLGASAKDQETYVEFVQELAEKLHERNCFFGQDIEQDTNDPTINFNITAMSQIVDWFTVTIDRFPHEGYMEPITPLKVYNGNAYSTTEFWIKKYLDLVKPKCLIVELGPWLTKLRAIESAVEPGPGSLVEVTKNSGRTDVSTVCYNLHYLHNDCREYWHEESSIPWAVCGDDLYTYDNARSLALKAKLIRQYNITGVMIWCEDIYPGSLCNVDDPFAILRAVQGMRHRNNAHS